MFLPAQIAQLVEQGTENPCVGGPIPSLGTMIQTTRQRVVFYFSKNNIKYVDFCIFFV